MLSLYHNIAKTASAYFLLITGNANRTMRDSSREPMFIEIQMFPSHCQLKLFILPSTFYTTRQVHNECMEDKGALFDHSTSRTHGDAG